MCVFIFHTVSVLFMWADSALWLTYQLIPLSKFDLVFMDSATSWAAWLFFSFLVTLCTLLLLLLSHFTRVRLCATPETTAHQAPPSLGFSRREHWSGLPFPSPMHESEKWKWSRSVVSDPQRPHGLQPSRLLHPWDFPGKSSGMGSHFFLQRIFPTRGWNLGFYFIWSLLFTFLLQ